MLVTKFFAETLRQEDLIASMRAIHIYAHQKHCKRSPSKERYLPRSFPTFYF